MSETQNLANPCSIEDVHNSCGSTEDLYNAAEEGESPYTGTVKGLTITTCAMFIIAEMAGSGILALPKAISEAGWTGVGLLVVCCFISLYCGIILGKCWTIVRNSNTDYHGHVRDPYPLIGLAASGKVGKYIVEFCVLVTLFGVCVVFLLLASEQIASLVHTSFGALNQKSEFRIWILICGAVLLPFTWLATPKEMWQFAVGAGICTMVACLFIIVRTGMYIKEYSTKPISQDTPVSVKSFFAAFGTIAFSFGGATLFPTFQTDMRHPRQFPVAATLAFIGVLIMYLPVSSLPFLAFGTKLDDNILKTLKEANGDGKAFVTAAETLITFHLLFTFVITINPIGQQIEEYIKLPHEFGWKRITLRTTLVLVIIGIAEAIPNFGPILSLIGGSTVTMMAFILPCWFYLKLKDHVPFFVKVLHVEIMLIAVVCGAAATYSAGSHFKNPFKTS